MNTLSVPCLCLVTSRHQCEGKRIKDVVEAALEGGATMVQLREKDLTVKQLFTLAKEIRALTRNKALLFINDRIDVALASDADGVQLGEQSLPVDTARLAARQTSGQSRVAVRRVRQAPRSAQQRD